MDKLEHDGQALVRYLLGVLPDGESQRMDELSVADEEFALRLQAAEDDLVDSFARGELSGETLRQFKSFYLSSPRGREKLAFAEALFARELNTASATARSSQKAVASQIAEAQELSLKRSPWRIFSVPRLALQWGFAGAAVAMALVAGVLFLEVVQLKRERNGAESERSAIDQREQVLEKQLNAQRDANAQTQSDLERLRNEASRFNTMKSIAVLLMPQTRGASQPVSVSVPAGIDALPMRLGLESDEFPEYQVALKEAGSDRAVWHVTNLKAAPAGKNKSLAISIPAKVLQEQTYILEANGIRATGAPKFISSYVFRVVLD